MENAINFLIILSLLSLGSTRSLAQDQGNKTLHDVLIDIALIEGVSLIFESSNIPNKQIGNINNSWSLEQKMDKVLKGTKLVYKYENEQIFLYKQRSIYGYLEDGNNGERLILATFVIPEENIYDVSNEHGYFSITTIKDSVQVVASYIGYEDRKIVITSDEMDKPITLKLYPNNQLEEILITDAISSEEERIYIEFDKGSDILLLQNQAITAVGGEPDVFQALIRQTGVNAGTDGLGGLHVRGGRNDQNLILYDGVKLYNSAHAFGIFSIINNSVVDRASVYKSGSNGALSGRLSSIMDIKIKEPNLKTFHTSIQTTTLASQATLEGPIIKDKIGISITGRRTHVDPIIKALSDKSNNDYIDGHTNYFFSDFNIKTYGKLNNKSRLYLTLYNATDNYNFTENYHRSDVIVPLLSYDDNINYKWKNKLASLRLNTLLGDKSFLNVILSAYKYDFNNILEYNSIDLTDLDEPFYNRIFTKFNSGILSHDLKLQAETILLKHEVKYGIKLSTKDFNVGNFQYEDIEFDRRLPIPKNNPLGLVSSGNYIAREMTIHLSDKYRANKSLIFDAGVYFNYNDSKDIDNENELASHQDVHGYLKGLFRINDIINIGGSIGKYIQTEHLLTVGDNGYPNDIWLPSTEVTPPEESYQYEVFFQHHYKNHRINLSAYYKTQEGLVWYDTIPTLPSLTDIVDVLWEYNTSLGSAKSYGLEVDYNYHYQDKFSMRMAYTLGETKHRFLQVNDGIPFLYDFSILHTVSLGMNAKFHPRLRMNMDWYYGSGKPYTSYTYDYPVLSPFDRETEYNVTSQSKTNGHKLIPSHKLSLSFSTYWYWGKSRNDLSIGVQNVYNRQNQLYKYKYKDDNNQTAEDKIQTGFPILPMFRWKISI